MNKDLAESFGLDKPSGALVAQLVEDGPAAKGGLQVGDVILSLNGQSINESADLPHLVGNMKPGDKINLDVIRNGQRKSLSMAVGNLRTTTRKSPRWALRAPSAAATAWA